MSQHAKPVAIKSKKLRDSAKGRACTIRLYPYCTGGGPDSVLCHVQFRGGIMGGKETDLSSAIGCDACHSIIDGRVPVKDIPELEIVRCVVRGMIETQEYWWRSGLLSIKGIECF